MILLINENKDSQFLPYALRYQLFDDWSVAILNAKLIGWEDPFSMGVNKNAGIANLFSCGDIKVTLIALEPQ